MRVITDTQEMEAAARDLAVVREEMRQLSNDLRDLIGRIEPMWQGNASRAYLEQLERQVQEINRVVSAVDAMRSTAQERAYAAQVVDQVSAAAVQSLAPPTQVVDLLRNLFSFLPR